MISKEILDSVMICEATFLIKRNSQRTLSGADLKNIIFPA